MLYFPVKKKVSTRMNEPTGVPLEKNISWHHMSKIVTQKQKIWTCHTFYVKKYFVKKVFCILNSNWNSGFSKKGKSWKSTYISEADRGSHDLFAPLQPSQKRTREWAIRFIINLKVTKFPIKDNQFVAPYTCTFDKHSVTSAVALSTNISEV